MIEWKDNKTEVGAFQADYYQKVLNTGRAWVWNISANGTTFDRDSAPTEEMAKKICEDKLITLIDTAHSQIHGEWIEGLAKKIWDDQDENGMQTIGEIADTIKKHLTTKQGEQEK